ncbi:MAG TPA: FAD-dependent oxidoreductase [Cellulomonas sp.]
MWLDDPGRPAARPRLDSSASVDVLVVGGGYLGLWSALRAKQQNPAASVVLLEAFRIGWAASGRNGGFVSSSVTHGPANGLAHWPGEIDTLERLGRENLDGMERELGELGVDCGFARVGELTVATQPHQVGELRSGAERDAALGGHDVFLDRDAVRERIDSPTFLAGVYSPGATALVNPARLAWGLADAAEGAGVQIHEHTPVRNLVDRGGHVDAQTDHGRVAARTVVLATNAFGPLLRRLRLYTVPVYDYALGTAPLTAEQLASIGWSGREGLADCGNQFHYSRLTDDNRILWGGYDAIYHFASGIRPEYDERPETFELLAHQFFETFPQLAGVAVDYAWGGVIDTCTRFAAFYGTAWGGKVGYAAGFTGLGVGATRFAADVLTDLLAGRRTERTELAMVRHKGLPWPPEPVRALGIEWTRASLAAADRNGGRRNLWLRALDAAGVGFDS